MQRLFLFRYYQKIDFSTVGHSINKRADSLMAWSTKMYLTYYSIVILRPFIYIYNFKLERPMWHELSIITNPVSLIVVVRM